MKKLNLFLLLIFCQVSYNATCQVLILNATVNAYNVTPQSILQVNIMNNNLETFVYLETRVTNSSNDRILEVTTQPFLLKKGMNSINGYSLQIARTEFGKSGQAEYIRKMHFLPGGKYIACYSLFMVSGEPGDEYCQDIDADINSFLSLISPFNYDTIDTRNPILAWTHSEPFNVLTNGEYFRIVLVELQQEQSAEAGMIANNPIFMMNYVTSHQQLYPYDAKELVPGKRYGWQVQKLANSNIINKSEAWEFYIAKEKIIRDNKYVKLKKNLDPGYYYAENNKVLFVFDEQYNPARMTCEIYNDKMETFHPIVKTDEVEPGSEASRKYGYNRFCIDLSEMQIKKGFYTLAIKNSKNEKFLLRILVP